MMFALDLGVLYCQGAVQISNRNKRHSLSLSVHFWPDGAAASEYGAGLQLPGEDGWNYPL